MPTKKKTRKMPPAGNRRDLYEMVRIPKTMISEISELMPELADDPAVRATGHISKALALRLILLRGIATVRAESRSKAKGGAST